LGKKLPPSFLPSPEEIQSRIEMLDWFRTYKVDLMIIESSMLFDKPTFDEIQNKILKLGTDKGHIELYKLIDKRTKGKKKYATKRNKN
jgi:hypothetical protein